MPQIERACSAKGHTSVLGEREQHAGMHRVSAWAARHGDFAGAEVDAAADWAGHCNTKATMEASAQNPAFVFCDLQRTAPVLGFSV